MDKEHSSKISLHTKVTAVPSDGDHNGYDLYMAIWELSVSMGNFDHDAEKSVKFLTENNTSEENPFELVLLNGFRMRFEQLQNGTDPEEHTLHETRGDLFMRLYKELVEVETDEKRRYEFLYLCFELFDSVYPKLKGRRNSFTHRVELIDRMHLQVKNILHRLNGSPDVHESSSESSSLISIYLESKKASCQDLSEEIIYPVNEIASEESLSGESSLDSLTTVYFKLKEPSQYSIKNIPIDKCLSKENHLPANEILSKENISTKLESSSVHIDTLQIEDYKFIMVCSAMTICRSKGIRIEKELSVSTSQEESLETSNNCQEKGIFKIVPKIETLSPSKKHFLEIRNSIKVSSKDQEKTSDDVKSENQNVKKSLEKKVILDTVEVEDTILEKELNVEETSFKCFSKKEYVTAKKGDIVNDLIYLFDDFQNKLNTVTEVTEKNDSQVLISTKTSTEDTTISDEKWIFSESDLETEEVNQTISTINSQRKLSVEKIFKDKTKSSVKNSKFTDELRRLISPSKVFLKNSGLKLSPEKLNGTICTQDDQKSLSPVLRTTKKLDGSPPLCLDKNHSTEKSIDKKENCKDLDKVGSPKPVKSYNEHQEDFMPSSGKLTIALSLEDDLIDDLNFKLKPYKSKDSFAKKLDKSLPVYSENLINVDDIKSVNSNDYKELKTALEVSTIKDDCLVKDDLSYKLTSDKSKELYAEQDDQQMLSPILDRISQTFSDIKLNVLKETDKSLSVISGISFSMVRNLKKDGNLNAVEDEPVNINLPSPNLSLYKSDECNLVNNNLVPDKLEQNQEMISPILSQITQTSSYVKLHVLKEVDKFVSAFSGRINLIDKSTNKDTSHEEEDSLTEEDLVSSCYLGTSISNLECSSLSCMLAPPLNENVDEQDNQERISPILTQISKTVNDIKFNILREVDKSLSELTLKSASDILLRKRSESKTLRSSLTDSNGTFEISELNLSNDTDTFGSQSSMRSETSLTLPLAEESDGIPNLCKQCDIKVKYSQKVNEYLSEGLTIRRIKCRDHPQWEHQRHIIAAPRVIIKTFKSNAAYKWFPNDPKAPDFYEQLDQFFEVIGQRGSCADFNISSIQLRLSKILIRIKTDATEHISFPEWVAIVGTCKFQHLLTAQENRAYESLRWILRDKGDQDLSPESRFTDALHGIMGYGSPHLKMSSLTGRLHLRSPQHQDSISDSYLLLTLGHLGYIYRELRRYLTIIEQKGETGAALKKCLQKYLLNFHQFYNIQKRNPSSLLCLYRKTRSFLMQYQWLLGVLRRMQNEKSILISLYEELGQRFGSQRYLLLKWLRVVSQPFQIRLVHWLSSGQLTSFNFDEFFIKKSENSSMEDFWQRRYQFIEIFSRLFHPQLGNSVINVGKTLVYSRKYLGINVGTCLNSKQLRNVLQNKFDQLFRYGDKEPLYELVHDLHFQVSAEVLIHLRKIKANPEYLFSQLHKYIFLADISFVRECIAIFGHLFGQSKSSFNTQAFNELKDRMLSKFIPELYIDKGNSEGTECWSVLVFRWRFPSEWIALLGTDAILYEATSMALWRFHYVNYICEKIFQKQTTFRNRADFKYFKDLLKTDNSFANLIKICLNFIQILKEYLQNELLESELVRLLLACNEANTLDDILTANRIYLRAIKLGTLQTRSLRKCNHYLQRLYNFILKLDGKQEEFLKISNETMDYIINDRMNKAHALHSSNYRDQKLHFCRTCQNYSDVIDDLKKQFNSAMISFLFSLHLADEDSLRLLALKLDPEGYYGRKERKLNLVQAFEFRRKAKWYKAVKNM